jgi:hypothetical protein
MNKNSYCYEVYIKPENSSWMFAGVCQKEYSIKNLARIFARMKQIKDYEFKSEYFKL